MFSTCPRLRGAQSAYKDEATLGRGRGAGPAVLNPGSAKPWPPHLAPKHLGPLAPGSRHHWGLATSTDATGPAALAMAALQPCRGIARVPAPQPDPAAPACGRSRRRGDGDGDGDSRGPPRSRMLGAGGLSWGSVPQPPSPLGAGQGVQLSPETPACGHTVANSPTAVASRPRSPSPVPAGRCQLLRYIRYNDADANPPPQPGCSQQRPALGPGAEAPPLPAVQCLSGGLCPLAAPGLTVELAHPTPEERAASRLAGGRPPDPPSQGQRLRPCVVPPARPCPRDAEGVGASEAAHGNILPVPVSLPPRCSCLTRARPALAVGRCRSCPPLKPHWMRPRMRWHGEAPSCHCQHWGRSPLGPVRCQARDGHRQEQSHMPGKSQKPLGRDWKGHGATPATGSCSGVRGAAVWLGSGWDLPVPPRPNHRHVLEPRLLGRGSRSPPTWDVATGLALGAHGPSLGRGTGTAGLWLAAGASRPARRGEWQRFGAGKDGMCLGWALLQFLRASNKGVTKAGGTPPAPGIVPLRRGSGSRGGVQSGAEPRLGGVQPPRLPPALGEPWSTPNPQPITPKAPAGPRGGGCRQVALKKKGWGRPGYWDQSALGTGPTAPNSGWHWGQCPGLTGPPGGSWAGRGWQPRQYIIIIYPVYWSCA